jgi:hypothetical protein
VRLDRRFLFFWFDLFMIKAIEKAMALSYRRQQRVSRPDNAHQEKRRKPSVRGGNFRKAVSHT